MRQVVDDSGQSLSFPSHPSHIVSLTYGTDEILLGLVDTSRVAALSRYAGNPDISFVTKEEAEAVGRKVDVNAESIMALKPDLVIVSTAVSPQLVSVLRQSGIPVYVSLVAVSWDEMEEKVRGVARAVNEEAGGEAMVQDMENKKRSWKKGFPSLALRMSGVLWDYRSGGFWERRAPFSVRCWPWPT